MNFEAKMLKQEVNLSALFVLFCFLFFTNQGQTGVDVCMYIAARGFLPCRYVQYNLIDGLGTLTVII